ncbi:conserved hypothetical protein [Streptomyces sviceus ATCC 29083]|uniref:Uncharacterized protein n=1 Tax=Streptomyces sviceus (strain ATCC 29083 / DSM 924 / JCM 4929 / NBRC 13980 / NCIMB 11184 / NRRL 5439 / UC 5370) TaxID=463191 RepID=B5I4E6_STRX2|nr:conserved hypothetical protein [Streptomyces sviceus ATCC 29083]
MRAAVAAFAARHAPDASTLLLGHSFGAKVALDAAMPQKPKDVRAVLEGWDRDVCWRLRLTQPQITRVCADRGYAGDRRGRRSHFST